jgi:hypothetical protein
VSRLALNRIAGVPYARFSSRTFGFCKITSARESRSKFRLLGRGGVPCLNLKAH